MIAWLVRFAIEAMFPTTEALPGCADTGSREFVPMMLAESSWLMWLGVVASAVAFQLLPLLTVYRPLPAALLSADTLDEHAYRFSVHPLYLVRQAGFLLKFAAGLCWGMDDRVRAHFGMDPFPGDPGTWRTS